VFIDIKLPLTSQALTSKADAMSDEEVLIASLTWLDLFGGKPKPLASQLGAVLVS